MGATDLLRALLSDADRGYDPYECRRCGTSLRRGGERCPVCGSDAVHRIDV